MSQDSEHQRDPGSVQSDAAVGGATDSSWRAICPYLRDASRSWRATSPTSEHRCTAVVPAGLLSAETQRSLCLVAGHVDCPVYMSARAVRAAWLGPSAGTPRTRPLPLTAAVVLERPSRIALAAGWVRVSLPQAELVLLIGLAAAALILARFIAP